MIAVELTDPSGAFVLGQHQDVKKHCALFGSDRVEAVAELALDVFEVGPTAA